MCDGKSEEGCKGFFPGPDPKLPSFKVPKGPSSCEEYLTLEHDPDLYADLYADAPLKFELTEAPSMVIDMPCTLEIGTGGNDKPALVLRHDRLPKLEEDKKKLLDVIEEALDIIHSGSHTCIATEKLHKTLKEFGRGSK